MFVSQVLKGENPTVFGNGKQMRCFTHAEDVAAGISAILASPAARNNIYNLGAPDEAISIRDLAQLVIDVLNPNNGLSIEFIEDAGPEEAKEIIDSYADITLAKNDLGYAPKITIEEGLRRLANAFKIDEDLAKITNSHMNES